MSGIKYIIDLSVESRTYGCFSPSPVYDNSTDVLDLAELKADALRMVETQLDDTLKAAAG